jgi:predicted GIY-YIG superfamily endonuclease
MAVEGEEAMSLDVDWAACQRVSDQILAEGLLGLTNQEAVTPEHVNSENAGNYLISLEGKMHYIGEAKHLASRIRQQFVARTSTFYKTYTKRVGSPSKIDAFRVRYLEVAVGRKELEEFGIVNAGCALNKFQLGKRDLVPCAATSTLWNEVQRRYATLIAQGEAALLAEPFSRWSEASAKACAGIYAARAPNGKEMLYLGESSNVHKRHKCHSRATYFSALRRHVGTDLFGFSLKECNGKAKYFTEDEDDKVTEFLCSCRIACMPVSFGRFELEEHLIRKFHPRLNRKDNSIEPDEA